MLIRVHKLCGRKKIQRKTYVYRDISKNYLLNSAQIDGIQFGRFPLAAAATAAVAPSFANVLDWIERQWDMK